MKPFLWGVAGIVFSISAMGLAQTKQPSMQEGLAAAVRQLGACQSELGAMRTLQADVISGKYMDIDSVKSMIEATNPKFVFDLATHKIALKPEKTE